MEFFLHAQKVNSPSMHIYYSCKSELSANVVHKYLFESSLDVLQMILSADFLQVYTHRSFYLLNRSQRKYCSANQHPVSELYTISRSQVKMSRISYVSSRKTECTRDSEAPKNRNRILHDRNRIPTWIKAPLGRQV
jgi:hypothetical protein